MGRVQRGDLRDGYFHVVSRGVFGARIFLDDRDRRRFLRLLRRLESEHRWTCHAYCLMTTHYHLVLETEVHELSRGMHRLNGRYSRAFNRSHGRFGHLFAERFATRRIDSEEYLYEACAYVVLNPVKARLCDRVEEWRWSYCRYGLALS